MAMTINEFKEEREQRIRNYANDVQLRACAGRWILESMEKQYVYNFEWMGRPIIQYPEDMISIQELVWEVKPSLIIETGVAHGGSLILSASMLALLDYCDAISNEETLDPKRSRRKVIGIDIDVRAHNRNEIEQHPLSGMIDLVEGSSTSPEVRDYISEAVLKYDKVMVFLDSNHTHNHVLEELNIYSKFVSVGSYCVVFDTIIENLPVGYFANRPWDKGNSPMTAVESFLSSNSNFEIDKSREDKLLITVSPNGYLVRKG